MNGSCVEINARLFHPLYMRPEQKKQYDQAQDIVFTEINTAAEVAECKAALHRPMTHLDSQIKSRLAKIKDKFAVWSTALEGELLRRDRELKMNNQFFSTLMIYGGVSAAQVIAPGFAPTASLFLRTEVAKGLASMTTDMLKYLIKSKTKSAASKFIENTGMGPDIISEWRKELMTSIIDAFDTVGDFATVTDDVSFKEHFHEALGALNRNNDSLEEAFRQSLLLDFIQLGDRMNGRKRNEFDNLYNFKVGARMISNSETESCSPEVEFIGATIPSTMTERMASNVIATPDIVHRPGQRWEFSVDIHGSTAIFSADNTGWIHMHDLHHSAGHVLAHIGRNRAGISDRYENYDELAYRAEELGEPEALIEYWKLQIIGLSSFFEAFEDFMGTQSLQESGLRLA